MTPAQIAGLTCTNGCPDSRGAKRLTLTERSMLFDAHNGLCWYCGVEMTRGADDFNRDPKRFTVDHLHPVIHGGITTPDNIVAACRRCNLTRKGQRKNRVKGTRVWRIS